MMPIVAGLTVTPLIQMPSTLIGYPCLMCGLRPVRPVGASPLKQAKSANLVVLPEKFAGLQVLQPLLRPHPLAPHQLQQQVGR